MRFQLKQVFPTKQLLDWYRTAKRDLPWRETRNPYFIWLSEIILQQTRVDQGLSYYHHFVDQYPTIQVLADAKEEEVLRSWQGLGYYSRARNLHAAARQVLSDGGPFPESYEEIIKLKGVGPYTAAAIASFAFDEVVPVADGNVNRVISRFLALEDPVDTSTGKKRIMQVLEEAIPNDDPATFNQSIMELGALVCKPRNPLCEDCPLSPVCLAFKQNSQQNYPVKKAKVKVRDVWMYSLLLADDHGVVLRKRGDDSVWRNMYDLPTSESDAALSLSSSLKLMRKEWQPAGLSALNLEPFDTTRHILSHRKLHVQTFAEHTDLKDLKIKDPLLVVRWEDLDKLPLPRLTENLLEKWRTARV